MLLTCQLSSLPDLLRAIQAASLFPDYFPSCIIHVFTTFRLTSLLVCQLVSLPAYISLLYLTTISVVPTLSYL